MRTVLGNRQKNVERSLIGLEKESQGLGSRSGIGFRNLKREAFGKKP